MNVHQRAWRRLAVFLGACIAALAGYLAVSLRSPGIPPLPDTRPGIAVADVDNAVRNLPPVTVLASFEKEKEVHNWIARYYRPGRVARSRTTEHATAGRYAMKVEWDVPRWGELVVLHFPEEWGQYRRFAVDIFNASPGPVRCEFRIGDYYDATNLHPETSRFVYYAVIAPGKNSVVIPIKAIASRIRIASPRKIVHLRFFGRNRVFYIDNMRLELPSE